MFIINPLMVYNKSTLLSEKKEAQTNCLISADRS